MIVEEYGVRGDLKNLQEGRHRSLMAIEAGKKTIPILLSRKKVPPWDRKNKNEEFRSYRDSDIDDSNSEWAQEEQKHKHNWIKESDFVGDNAPGSVQFEEGLREDLKSGKVKHISIEEAQNLMEKRRHFRKGGHNAVVDIVEWHDIEGPNTSPEKAWHKKTDKYFDEKYKDFEEIKEGNNKYNYPEEDETETEEKEEEE